MYFGVRARARALVRMCLRATACICVCKHAPTFSMSATGVTVPVHAGHGPRGRDTVTGPVCKWYRDAAAAGAPLAVAMTQLALLAAAMRKSRCHPEL